VSYASLNSSDSSRDLVMLDQGLSNINLDKPFISEKESPITFPTSFTDALAAMVQNVQI